MWWKALLFIIMTAAIVAAFVTEAPQQQIGEASRIFYFHIPQAWISVLAFAMSMIYSIGYLRKRDILTDGRAADTAAIGLLVCILAAATGSIFAKVTWGSFWNWDPRESSIFLLLLIYGAYFALRGAVQDENRRATLSAVYSIFAFLTVPFLVFVLPRMVPSLHPSDSVVDENMKFVMGAEVWRILLTSLVGFSVLYLWMFNISGRIRKLSRARFEEI